jgi:hypothetical protein
VYGWYIFWFLRKYDKNKETTMIILCYLVTENISFIQVHKGSFDINVGCSNFHIITTRKLHFNDYCSKDCWGNFHLLFTPYLKWIIWFHALWCVYVNYIYVCFIQFRKAIKIYQFRRKNQIHFNYITSGTRQEVFTNNLQLLTVAKIFLSASRILNIFQALENMLSMMYFNFIEMASNKRMYNLY